MESSVEKVAKTPRDLLHICSTATRFWQLASSCFIFVSVSYVFRRSPFRDDFHLDSLQPLVFITLGYSSFVIVCVAVLGRVGRTAGSRSWLLFALMTIPGDLSMLSVFVAKVAVVGIQYLECHAQVGKDALNIEIKKRDAAEKVLFASPFADVVDWPPSHQGIDHPTNDVRECYFPKGIYALAVVAIFSYILSIVFTVLQVWRHRRAMSATPAGPYRGHVIEAIPEPTPRQSMVQVRPPPMCGPMVPQQLYRGESSAGPSNRGPSTECSQEPKYANMPEGIIASMAASTMAMVGDVVGRMSHETTSSIDPDIYLVTDGFRNNDDPPEYTSRPSSLYGMAC